MNKNGNGNANVNHKNQIMELILPSHTFLIICEYDIFFLPHTF